ncbi:hypothetical protein B9L23_02255 [Parageobacillus galactosidasius]|uniref:LysM domain-containing protein n=1 Tax=Parageobacillus galactosidasius TaxID=883812 RepID=A0A226QRR8_9BACL|nr:hypothetical protein B9L23_02255 [Parageobacillus galactosidasius]
MLKAEYYVVKKGDVLSRIAQKYGISVKQIQALNPNSNLIYPDRKIRVK